MARRKQTRGTCLFCGQEMSKGGLSRHLNTCPQRAEAAAAAGSKHGRDETIFHLQVQDAWVGDYWLHLEMRAGAKLEDLDYYLRAIWLECCGHLSAFEIGPYRYTQIFYDGLSIGDEKPMNIQVGKVFEAGLKFSYEYDFGTTSELEIKVVGSRQGKALSPKPIYLMARNLAPQFACQECGRPATWLCQECMYEDDLPGMLCDEHDEDHPHEDYGGTMPLVNSPRVGMCGYEGPAEPPY